ncbi:MAG: prepilin-type N-terminal cleavage/methylation domain-containing protein [Chitinispirillaceae bacterium]|nr:prepilin-type N-terminal cleavage/methylation domain-containing protein [Chitinispirillaceae bacterium]
MKKYSTGFTIVELLVALAISGVALVILSKLLSLSLNTYNLQEQLADMNQNARFTINEISDIIMEAGSDLQVMGIDTVDRDTIIIPDGGGAECSGFTIKINPRGGFYQFPQKVGSPVRICTVHVDDAKGFRMAPNLQRIPVLGTKSDLTYYSIVNVDTLSNYIVFSPADSFQKGDAICSFSKTRYYLNGTDLCVDSDMNIISENIDSLSILFLDNDYKPTSQWRSMRAARIFVRVKTALPDKRYKEYADHHHRISLNFDFRLRNKIDINK